MSDRPFIGARIEDAVHRRLGEVLTRREWKPLLIPFRGYGSQNHIRILARVILAPHEIAEDPSSWYDSDMLLRRGWRNFGAVPAPQVRIEIETGGACIMARTDRLGYLDVRVRNEGLAPGWHDVLLRTEEGRETSAPILVVDSSQTFGIVSDIDDTVISTSLPRGFIAAWNTFVLTEQARQSIPGMARMYQKLLAEHPAAPVIYVSTGSWTTYPFLTRFLRRHGYPTGPMLLTDWGPTNTGWFRSGPNHKRQALRELARDFPNITWLLVGDDGQRDISLYQEFAELQPGHVRAIAIRQLSPTQQVLAHGTAVIMEDDEHVQWVPDPAPLVRAPDGDKLHLLLKDVLS